MSSERLLLEGQSDRYALTIGLEVHAQIATKAKLFSRASTRFGAAPNTNVSLVDAAFPGMLPRLNQQCVMQALKTSLGLNGHINLTSYFDRKNYFYPDLPQGYQITQFYTPLMENGFLDIEDALGGTKRIRINRLHIEQDAGKSLHEEGSLYSAIDLNRVGVGLMEIVTDPDLTSPDEAITFLKKLRQILICLGTSDGSMEEGSLRVDANVSVALPLKPLGTRVEIKNLNSFRFLQQAVLYEAHRQISEIEKGNPIMQETRLFDTQKKETRSMRSKEDAQEYRYFPDPDLPPLVLDPQLVERVKAKMPELPEAKKQRFQKEFGLSTYDASIVTADLEVTCFFEETVTLLKHATPKLLTNWLMGEVIAAVNESGIALKANGFHPTHLAQLLELIATETLSGKMAKDVFQISWQTGDWPEDIVNQRGFKQINNREELEPLILEILNAHTEKVLAYQNGKEKLFGFFVGQVMKQTSGMANPTLLNRLLKELLAR